MDEEGNLRLERGALERSLPATQHLRDDVLQVFGERKGDTFGADRGDIASRRGRLAGQRGRLRGGSRRGLARDVVRSLGRRRLRHGALGRRLLARQRGRFLLGGTVDDLGRLLGLLGRQRRRDQVHLVHRGRRLARLGRGGEHEKHGEPVDRDRARQPETHVGGSPAASPHRSIVSGSATRPTSLTPDARMAASTWTTMAYGTRPSARRYTPVGRLVRTKAGKVARKSSYVSAAWSRKMRPSRSRLTTSPDFGSRGRAWARGRRTSTPPCMMGAVIMKMMSSTNATSTSDVTLMSALRGSSPWPRSPPPPPSSPATYNLPSRAIVPMISCAKPSSSPAKRPSRLTNRLYAITAGTATASPATVVTSASATPGATAAMLPEPPRAIPMNASITPSTVPSSPRSGLTDPKVASQGMNRAAASRSAATSFASTMRSASSCVVVSVVCVSTAGPSPRP